MRHETPKPAETVIPSWCKCVGCKAPTHLCDLNERMECEVCGEPDEDPEGFEPSEAELRKYERTY